jgi:fimbrial chaperone protein
MRTVAVALLCAAAPAAAGPLAIAPTTVEIADGARSAVVEVTNTGGAPVLLQFRAYDWTQVDGRDRLEPTDALVVSPAIVSVAAGATQIFRVLRATPARADAEQTYRLRLNQIPVGTAPGVGINLEFLLPVFAGGGALKPELRLIDDQPTGGTIRIANTGGRHAKVGRIQAVGFTGSVTDGGRSGGATYILAGGRAALPISERTLAPGAHLAALGERGVLDVAAPTVVASR